MEGEFYGAPSALANNNGKCVYRLVLVGMGFTFDDAGSQRGATDSLDSMEKRIATES